MLNNSKSNILANLALIIANASVAVGFVSIKIASTTLPPFTINFIRMFFAFGLLFLIYKFMGNKFNFGKKDIFLLSIGGIVGFALCGTLDIIGIKYTTASNASLIVAFTPAIGALADRVIFKSKLTLMSIIGIIVSIVGAYFVITTDGGVDLSKNTLLGNLVVLLGNVFFVLYVVINRFIGDKYSEMSIAVFQNAAAALILLPPAISEHPNLMNVSSLVLFNILFLGLFTSAISSILMAYAAKRVNVTVTSAYTNLIPVVGVLTGYLLLGEKVTPLQAFGGIIIILGVTIVNKFSSSEAVK